jgi:hypothetical protein
MARALVMLYITFPTSIGPCVMQGVMTRVRLVMPYPKSRNLDFSIIVHKDFSGSRISGCVRVQRHGSIGGLHGVFRPTCHAMSFHVSCCGWSTCHVGCHATCPLV